MPQKWLNRSKNLPKIGFNKSTKDFLSHYQPLDNSLTDLVKIIQGGNYEQGTWMHEDVALEFALVG